MQCPDEVEVGSSGRGWHWHRQLLIENEAEALGWVIWGQWRQFTQQRAALTCHCCKSGLGSFVCRHLCKDPRTARAPTSDAPRAPSPLSLLARILLDFLLSSTSATFPCCLALDMRDPDLSSDYQVVDTRDVQVVTEKTTSYIRSVSHIFSTFDA